MKKEKLLQIKRNTVDNELMYSGLGMAISDEELKNFSIEQLKLVCNILKRNKDKIESNNPFYTLSATEVIHKDSGKIVDFDYESTGGVKEVNREHILSGASKPILEAYEKRKDNK